MSAFSCTAASCCLAKVSFCSSARRRWRSWSKSRSIGSSCAGVELLGFGPADEDGDAVDVELLEAPAEFLGRAALDFLAMREQVEHVRALRDVAEVRGEDRIERLRDEPLTSPKRCTTRGAFS